MTLGKSLDLPNLSLPAVKWVPFSLPCPALPSLSGSVRQMEEDSVPGRLDVDGRDREGPE